MRIFVIASLIALVTGCSNESQSENCEDNALCESAFTVTVANDGATFAPGVYTFDIAFDGLRTAEDCTVGAAPSMEARCTGGLITPVVDNFAVTSFRIKGPAATRAMITVRQPCVDSALGSETFEPTYACATGCRNAAATMRVKSAGAFTICPDAGAD